MKIGIIIHGVNNVDFDAYSNHLNLIASLPKEHQYALATTKNVKVAKARNLMIEGLIEKFNPDKIFTIDTDHILPSDTLHKLLEADVDVVSGLICKRAGEYQQVGLFTKDDKNYSVIIAPKSGLYYVDICAFGCTLIDCKIFEKLQKPYFYDLTRTRNDVNFCIDVKKVGGKIAIHSDVLCGHIISESIAVYPYNNHKIKQFMQGINNGSNTDSSTKSKSDT